MVLRQGEQLFSLSMTTPSSLSSLASARELARTKIVAGTSTQDRLWLFLESSKRNPFALEARKGQVAEFEIPGLAMPGDQTSTIQSIVIVRHFNAALLMVSGGDRETWPREGNRPVYFWLSLMSGKVIRFPIGWDPDFFGSDQSVVVFEKPLVKQFARRPVQAVDLRTGAWIEGTPDRRRQRFIPFNWTETQSVKPLYRWRPETGERNHFAGLSLHGQVFPLDLGRDAERYLSTAKVRDMFAGFRLRAQGSSPGDASPLWLVNLKDPGTAARVEDAATDFSLLDGGNCIFITGGHGPKKISSEAFFYSYKDRTRRNLLDGIQRLPGLKKEFMDQEYIADQWSARVTDGFGGPGYRQLVLCVFSHSRMDMRAMVAPRQGSRLDGRIWRRALVLAGDGTHYLTDLFQQGNLPDRLWIHNSGKIIIGHHEFASPGAPRIRITAATVPIR